MDAAALVAILLWNAWGYLVAWRDKRAARSGGRRVRERTLHAMALLGAGAGVFAALLLHRHKTRKPRFLVPFVGATLLGAALVGAALALL